MPKAAKIVLFTLILLSFLLTCALVFAGPPKTFSDDLWIIGGVTFAWLILNVLKFFGVIKTNSDRELAHIKEMIEYNHECIEHLYDLSKTEPAKKPLWWCLCREKGNVDSISELIEKYEEEIETRDHEICELVRNLSIIMTQLIIYHERRSENEGPERS